MAKKSTRTDMESSPDELKKMISEAAYYLAEQRHFEGECQMHDWFEAEKNIHRIYGEGINK